MTSAHPGPGAALLVLCAAMPEARGGGDFDLEENWHGPERTFPEHNAKPGPMPEEYAAIAKRTIGRWAGDRIALVGDYAEDTDLPAEFHAATIYSRCVDADEEPDPEFLASGLPFYTDISADVARVLEHELGGTYQGDGWRDWVENAPNGQPGIHWRDAFISQPLSLANATKRLKGRGKQRKLTVVVPVSLKELLGRDEQGIVDLLEGKAVYDGELRDVEWEIYETHPASERFPLGRLDIALTARLAPLPLPTPDELNPSLLSTEDNQ